MSFFNSKALKQFTNPNMDKKLIVKEIEILKDIEYLKKFKDFDLLKFYDFFSSK